MPIEDNIVDQGEDLDFDPSFDNLFYSAGLDDCLFDDQDSVYPSKFLDRAAEMPAEISQRLGYFMDYRIDGDSKQ